MQFTKVAILVNFSREDWMYMDLAHISQCIYLLAKLDF